MTSPKWTERYAHQTGMTSGAVIDSVIEAAPDYYAGELETLRSKFNKLQAVVVTLVDLLPAAAQQALVEAHGYNYVQAPEDTK